MKLRVSNVVIAKRYQRRRTTKRGEMTLLEGRLFVEVLAKKAWDSRVDIPSVLSVVALSRGKDDEYKQASPLLGQPHRNEPLNTRLINPLVYSHPRAALVCVRCTRNEVRHVSGTSQGYQPRGAVDQDIHKGIFVSIFIFISVEALTLILRCLHVRHPVRVFRCVLRAEGLILELFMAKRMTGSRRGDW